jgi:SOS response regulatory protein OraA/RecX
MALKKNEKLVLEAIQNCLDDVALGVKAHKDQDEERAHTFTFLHEDIEQAFRLETINLDHYENVASAFSKIHSHRYLDDPRFALSFQKEMTARAVPIQESEKAMAALEKIRNKFLDDQNERDGGFNPDMADIIKVSQPQQIEESLERDLGHESQFFKDPKVRKKLEGNKTFWESVNARITPYLKELGYKCDTPKEFWEAYDDDDTEFVVRDLIHELFEQTQSTI